MPADDRRVTYCRIMTTRCVHLFYGLSGSGKSTLARQLCAEGSAVRFTLDEWMLRLHPELRFDTAQYGERAGAVRELIWSVAEQVLATGVDVALDWNSWSPDHRAWAVQRARAGGAEVVIHWLTTSADVAARRLEARSAAELPYAHPTTAAGNEHLLTLMEDPDPAEGLRIVRH